MNGAHATVEPDVNFEGDQPTITGWITKLYAGWREGGGPARRHTIRCATRDQAVEAGRNYLKALVEIPDVEVISLDDDQFSSRPSETDEETEQPGERWWERYAST